MISEIEERKSKILVIDLNIDIHKTIKNIFPEYEITCFLNENEAMEELKLNSKYYSIVLIDLNLLYDIEANKKEIKEHKIEIFKKIKEINKNIPVVIMTSIPKWQEYENIFNTLNEINLPVVHKVEDIIPNENGKIDFREKILEKIKEERKKQFSGSILVVDDEEAIAEGIKVLMPEYKVVSSKFVDDAIDILRDRSFDVLILDMKMEPKSGRELIPIIQEKYPYLSVIVNTGYPDTFKEQEILEELKGFNYYAYVTKTQEPLSLRNKIIEAHIYHNNFKKMIREKLEIAFIGENTCPYSVFFNPENEITLTIEELPKEKIESGKLIEKNFMPFCKISQLIKKMIEDREKRVCPCLVTIGDENYYIKGKSIYSFICSYYSQEKENVMKAFYGNFYGNK